MQGSGVGGVAVVVVGVAILRHGRVLAARRSGPEHAGGWELPGGKVEPWETPETAAVREIDEELGCAVEVTGWLDGSEPIDGGPGADRELVLRICTARLVGGEPVPAGEGGHDMIRWLAAEQLDEVAWLPSDRPFLDGVRAALADDAEDRPLEGSPARALFADEETAGEVAGELRAGGFDVRLERAPFAGDDDDEDHAWAVTTDAPEAMLDLLAEEHDGWVDHPEDPARRPAPIRLPTAPRRRSDGGAAT